MPAARAFAFDAYGTLFDVAAAIMRHRDAVGPDAAALAALWRQRQLEYSWTGTLMGRTRDFWQLTQDALDFALASFPAVDPALKPRLLDAYWTLDAYADVEPTLARLAAAGQRLAIFTNGTAAMARGAAEAAGIARHFEAIVTVQPTGRFKTHPETYAHLCRTLALPASAVTLVSSNRWDIAGAKAAGLAAIWCNRAGAPAEYADLPPDRAIRSLVELA
jgi:2-haloacid dehalogenase